ncbi:glycosyltransferase family 4 protein [Sphingobium algorifonticola]|uniref:Glycosyltransferase n=1 Tax=Sphingobium algorifonticola TaxID=2008318 RepID=A0A437J5J1_9SPHN|nr:glycosyltransferase family 4 protein [Sphingobium algorifonticola]RVT39905.1 glycosyltransferase [Sphingobium algorifonticola]
MRNRVFVVGARGIPDVEGGAEKNAERLFPLMVRRGWDVTLAGIADNLKSSDYRGVKLVGAPASRLLRTDKLFYYVAAIFMALRRRPHVVHMQGLGSAIMLWAYKLIGARTVVRYGSADYLLPKWGFLGRMGFLFSEFQLRFADAVIAVTPALADRLAARGIKGNVHVIANATDASDDFDGSPPPELPPGPYFLAVGRVTEQKNVHRLVEGFNLFAKDHPEALLVIAGGVDDESYMVQVRPHLTPRTLLLGRLPRSSLGALYSGAHCYINSSIHEGSSNAVLEAISWKAPILLSDIPENRDFGIGDAHYFDPEDPVAIASAMARVMADRESLIADPAKFMTWDDVADRTSAVYRAIGLVAAAH